MISKTEFTAGMLQALGKDVVKSFIALDKNEDGVLDMAELFPRGANSRAT
jgi:Ca2+-binding EF-hand superfamily protein